MKTTCAYIYLKKKLRLIEYKLCMDNQIKFIPFVLHCISVIPNGL